MPKKALDPSFWFFFALILLIGAGLRFYGLDWALPSDVRLFPYHSSEYLVVKHAFRLNLFSLELNPHFFDYGTHFIYINYFAFLVASAFGWVDLTNPIAWMGQKGGTVFLISRTLSVFYSLGTIAVVGWISEKFLSQKTALIAMIFCALSPLLIYESHFGTVESCLTFWCTAAVAMMANHLRTATPITSARWMGFFVGLAIGVKYSALLLIPLGFFTLAWKIGGDFNTPVKKRLIQCVDPLVKISTHFLLALFFGFILTMPYALIDFAAFWRDMVRETFTYQRDQTTILFRNDGNGLGHFFWVSLRTALGWPLWLLSLFSLAKIASDFWGEKKIKRWNALLVVSFLWACIGIAALSASARHYLRYLAPFIPIFCVLAAAGLNCVKPKLLALALTIVVMAYTGAYALARSKTFAAVDSRDRAARWIHENIKPTETLAMGPYSLWNSPPLAKPIIQVNGPEILITSAPTPFRILTLDENGVTLSNPEIDYYVCNYTTEIELGLRDRNPDIEKFWQHLQRHFQLAAEFITPIEFMGINFGEGKIPFDWTYATPKILIFKKR